MAQESYSLLILLILGKENNKETGNKQPNDEWYNSLLKHYSIHD
ncbi:MAG: hypothetical protein ACQEP8_05940 [Chlamydiota bacterium]